MARTDIHRPSVINPDDYVFVSFHSHHEEDFAANLVEQQVFRDHMTAHPGAKFSNHHHGGSCHVCGANAMSVARFYHTDTNTYVEVGETCMEKMGSGDVKAFQHFIKAGRDARRNAAGKAKAEMVLKDAGLDRAWDLWVEWTTADKEYHFLVEGYMSTLANIVFKLIEYGNLSEKQLAFLKSLTGRIDGFAEMEDRRNAEKAAAAPVPVVSGRTNIIGKVLTIKEKEGPYGFQLKMLVQHADGWKVWGSVPSKLQAERGCTVKFDAKVQVSKDDPKFGFFSRPTKASVIVSAFA